MTPKGRQYKPEFAFELLKIAAGDLNSARDLVDGKRGRPENVCYLAQQSIEKCIKAVTCKLGLPMVHTHDLEALISMLPEKHRPPGAMELKALTEYATVRRYEEGYAILNRTDLDGVIVLAEKTLLWAELLIQGHG